MRTVRPVSEPATRCRLGTGRCLLAKHLPCHSMRWTARLRSSQHVGLAVGIPILVGRKAGSKGRQIEFERCLPLDPACQPTKTATQWAVKASASTDAHCACARAKMSSRRPSLHPHAVQVRRRLDALLWRWCWCNAGGDSTHPRTCGRWPHCSSQPHCSVTVPHHRLPEQQLCAHSQLHRCPAASPPAGGGRCSGGG